MIIPLGSLLIIICVFIGALFVLFYIPYYVGIFVLLTVFIILRKRVPNSLCYVKVFTSSIVFWFNYVLDIILGRMLNTASRNMNRNRDGPVKYRLSANAVRNEELQPVDFTIRHRRFDSIDRLVHTADEMNSVQGSNYYCKRSKNHLNSRSEGESILSPIHYNESDRNILNSVGSVKKMYSKASGLKYSPTSMVSALSKSSSPSTSRSRNIENKTSRLSQTYFELDGMKENVNVSYSPESSWDNGRPSPLSYSQSLLPERENCRSRQNFYSRSYVGLSPDKRHSDSGGVLTHQSKYAGPGQLPRVCLGRPNLLLTFSGSSLSKCVQSPVRAKPSTVLPKTRAYRLINDSTPKFSAKFEETSRKRNRNSYEEEDDDDLAKRQCTAEELSNCDNLEEDSVNLKRAREDSPKSDFDQHHQKPKKRVCNNEILSSLSSSKNFDHASARKRKAAVVDWSRSSTPVQEKLFKKSINSPEVIINNNQEVELSLTKDKASVSQEELQSDVHDDSDKLRTPVGTASLKPKNSTEKSQIFNYTLFDVPITVPDNSVKENSPVAAFVDLNSSLEGVPKIGPVGPEKKNFDTKELEREAISKRLSSFWDAFGSVDVNKARTAMAPQKSAHNLDNGSAQVVATSTPTVCVSSSVFTSTLQQQSLPNIPELKDKNEPVNLLSNKAAFKSVATSAASVFTHGQCLSQSEKLQSQLNLQNLVGSSAADSPTATSSAANPPPDTSSETVTGQNNFSVSSSPLISGSGGLDGAPLTGSIDLQRSKSAVSLSANVQLTSSSITSPSSGLSDSSKGAANSSVLSQSVQAVRPILTSVPFSSASTNSSVTSTSNKPLFGFTSPFSSNFETNSVDGKQNPGAAGEKKVGGFSFSFTTPTTTSDDKNKSLTSSVSLSQATSSAVSSTQPVLSSSSITASSNQGGFSFPKFSSTINHVDASKTVNIFGSPQTSGGFGSLQGSSGFGSAQTSGFGTVPTSGFGKVETSPGKFGTTQGTSSVQGFGDIKVTSVSGFGNAQTSSNSRLPNVPSSQVSSSGFGSVSTSGGFGNVQTTSGGGFGNIQAAPKNVFENSQSTQSGFGNVPATSGLGFGSVPSTSSNIFGTSQTATNSTAAPFSFGVSTVQKTASAFSFGASTITTSSAATPVQSSGFGNAASLSGQTQTSQLVLFGGGSDANKNQAPSNGTSNSTFVFGGGSTTPKPGGFAFGSSHSSQSSTSTTVTLNFGSGSSSQAPAVTSGKFSFSTPQSQSSVPPMAQSQLSFGGSGSGVSSQQSQSPFGTLQSQQSGTVAVTQKPALSFGTPQSSFGTPQSSFGTPQASFGMQQMQSSGSGMLTQQPQTFGAVQQQTSGASSLMQQPRIASVNPLLQNVGQQSSPFGSQTQQSGGGFNFSAGGQQQQQQQQQHQQQQQNASSSSGLFGASSQTSTFQFGSAPSGTSQSLGGFSFGNVASASTAPVVNFNAGSNANNSFQLGAPANFGGSSAGMFSIGSGSTAPRARSAARSRRALK